MTSLQIIQRLLFAPQVSSLRAWRQRAQGAGATSIVLLLLAAAVHGTTYQATETAIEDTESLLRPMLFQSVDKERDHCATLQEECSDAKFCITTGYRCIKGKAVKESSGL